MYIAGRNGIGECYAREWLSALASAGYLDYDPPSGRFTLRVIEGEHFFLTSARSLVLSAVAEDLRPYLGRERP